MTNEIKHTPGPWEYIDGKGIKVGKYIWTLTTDDLEYKAGPGMSDEEIDAVGNLIAAAPELLEACASAVSAIQTLYHRLPDESDRDRILHWGDIIGKAINKAKGLNQPAFSSRETASS